MIQNTHNTILREKGWAESGRNHKPVTVLGTQKWWPMMVPKNGVHKSFFPITALNI